MVGAAKIVEEARARCAGYHFGCPVKKVAGKGRARECGRIYTEGAGDHPRGGGDAVEHTRTVKTRFGGDCNSKVM